MLMLLLRVDYSMRTYIIRMSPRKRYLSAGQKKKKTKYLPKLEVDLLEEV
jgi:hypothetical protein